MSAWLGFFNSKRPTTAATKGTTAVTRKSVDSFADDDEFESTPPASSSSSSSSSSTQPTSIRELTPDEIAKLQSENEQLKKLIEQLSSKAAARPPATNPNAASPSTPATYSFRHVDMALLNSNKPATAQNTTPVTDFYASLRASLASSNTPAKENEMKTNEIKEESIALDSEDEWGEPKKTSSSSAAPVDSVHAPRTEDEAIVHNKYASVVVHKKPLKPQLVDDDSTTNTTAATTAISSTAPKASVDSDFEDEFGMEMETPAGAAPRATSGDEPDEEIAIFDVSQADWWCVVPHPDREGEELVSAPPAALDPAEDDDGFIVIKNKDSLAALGEFISSLMAKHPEMGTLSPDQLRTMLEQSMLDNGITQPSTFGKVWSLGKQTYTVLSYSNWAWQLYKDQTTIRLVGSFILKAATWTAVILM